MLIYVASRYLLLRLNVLITCMRMKINVYFIIPLLYSGLLLISLLSSLPFSPFVMRNKEFVDRFDHVTHFSDRVAHFLHSEEDIEANDQKGGAMTTVRESVWHRAERW